MTLNSNFKCASWPKIYKKCAQKVFDIIFSSHSKEKSDARHFQNLSKDLITHE